ncbi:MAG TPA: carboxypeptidase-like regulatory domain-containing protein [Bryobacteraceae bacterium]|nr:carboxypeptidase-like regulatory domain-containing protein [Bryobacteraceae bacterium]
MQAATLLAFLIGCFSTTSIVFAQSAQAVISGVVTDPAGAAVVGAKVTVTNAATGVSLATTTNASGSYLAPNLKIGAYTVTVEHESFKRYSRTDIVLSTAERLGLDVHLELGQVAETVTVSSEAPVIEDKTSTSSK